MTTTTTKRRSRFWLERRGGTLGAWLAWGLLIAACPPPGGNDAGPGDGGAAAAVWTTVEALSPPRTQGTLTALPDPEQALAVGGLAGEQPIVTGPASLFLGDRDRWRDTGGEVRQRFGHSATELGGNRVIVAGGLMAAGTAEPLAQIYRIENDAWEDLGEIVEGRSGHVAVSLSVGELLLVSGRAPDGAVLDSVEELAEGSFSILDARLDEGRVQFAAAQVGADDFIVVGGLNGGGIALSSVEYLRVGDAAFSARQAMRVGRANHTATTIDTGRVVVIGGRAEQGGQLVPTASIEVYEWAADQWADYDDLLEPRWGHTATLLDDGRILIAGGFGAEGTPLATTEILETVMGTVVAGPTMDEARANHPAALLSDGSVLVAHGSTTPDNASAANTVERLRPPF